MHRLSPRPVAMVFWALVVLATGKLCACSIPVFRYALESWQPDPYEVLVFHRGPLSADDETLLSTLTPEYVPGEPIPNAAVSRIDLDGQVRPEFAAIWEADQGARLPWIVVRTPWRGENETVWKGSLSAESVATIQRSPVRDELVKRLAGGESVVWVLLEGTDAARNDKLATQVTDQLQHLQGGIKLPEIAAEDLSTLSVSPDQLGLKFSVLRLPRGAEGEQLLRSTLLTVKPGLDAPELATEPMLFPIFGRCRVYFPLVGSAIEPVNLEDLARFLTGACQCTIKQQNPGVDLLTTVDWDAYVLGIETEKPLPPLTGLAGFAATTAEKPGAAQEMDDQLTAAGEPAAVAQPVVRSDETGNSTEQTSHDAGAPAAAPMAEKSSTVPSSQADSIGTQVLWVIGLVTAVVVIASLVLIPRRPA